MKEKSIKWTSIFLAALGAIFALAGIYALVNPFSVGVSIAYFSGTLLLVYGAVLIVSFFLSSKDKSVGTLILGFITIVLGITCFIIKLFGLNYLMTYLVASSLIVIGFIKLLGSFSYNRKGTEGWWSGLLLGAFDIIIGLLSLFFPLNSLATYFGIGLIATGIADLLTAFTTLNI